MESFSEQYIKRYPKYAKQCTAHMWRFKWPVESFKIQRVFLELFGSNSQFLGYPSIIVKVHRNVQWTWMATKTC